MTYSEIIKDLKNKIYKPVYLFFGEEPFFIDELTAFISNNILNETEQTFNKTVLYGKETTVETIIQISRRFPMMSNVQIVIVKEAQELKKIKDLEIYLEKPLKSTILVLCIKETKSIDKRTKWVKYIEANGTIFESKRLYERDVYNWMTNAVKSYKLSLSPDAQRLMYEHIGDNISRINNELKKLSIILPPNSTVDKNTIAQNIGINRDFNIFELQKALGCKDIKKTYKIIDYFEKNPKAMAMVMAIKQLYDYFIKILIVQYSSDKSKNYLAAQLGIPSIFVDEYNRAAALYSPAKIVNIVSYIREADVKSKGVGCNAPSEGEIYKELIFKILH